MRLTAKHAATLMSIAANVPNAISIVRSREDLLNHDHPLIVDVPALGHSILTEHGQFVVAEMLNAMESAT